MSDVFAVKALLWADSNLDEEQTFHVRSESEMQAEEHVKQQHNARNVSRVTRVEEPPEQTVEDAKPL